jgi:hypothetical protein
MKNKKMKSIGIPAAALGIATTSVIGLMPQSGYSCACGCGVFNVGTSAMLPEGPGGMAFVDYDFQDQNINWSGNQRAQASDNGDKEIATQFGTIGVQYMFNRSWGVQGELPIWNRTFRTDLNFPETAPARPDIISRNWTGLSDVRLEGIYTGFSPDLSSGLTFGLKLPTGSINHFGDVVDRDSELGSGSTDILLGGYHRDRFGTSHFNWFVQASVDVPTLKMGGYRPGMEFDGAGGLYYDGWSLGRVQISPVLQIIGSWRGRDNGSGADPEDSGYQRVLLSPGIEFDAHPVRFYVDAELPAYVNVTGNQLVAPVLLKASISYMF